MAGTKAKTKAAQVTQIDRASVNVLRGEIDAALKSVLDKHGLIGVLGNITYSPGSNFRCKLLVNQPRVAPTALAPTPKVGDVWMIGAKNFKVVEVRIGDAVLENVNARPKWGRPAKRYRMNLVKMQATATFVR